MKQLRFPFLALAVLLLAACGSDSGGSRPATQTTSSGPVTAFGSVFVNGIEFQTSGATSIEIDDSPGSSENELRVGMMVRVRGTSSGSNGTATQIVAADSLEGPVTVAPDTVAGTIGVLGQTVITDATTHYENLTGGLGALSLGQIVEVSGSFDATGALRATRLELKVAVPTATTPIEVKGSVAGLTGSNFTLGALTIVYGGATLVDFPSGTGLANGQFVEVKSTYGQLAGATLTAASIELEPGLEATGQHVELKGFVNSFDGVAKTFRIGTVMVDASTLSLPAGLADNSEVEVEGTMNALGVLIAAEIELELEQSLALEGDATATNVALATITVLGKTVYVTPTTEFLDSSSVNLRTFGLADIAAGDHLDIVACDNAGAIRASRIERRNHPIPEEALLKGRVSATTPETALTILGTSVAVDPTGVNTAFRDSTGSAVTATAFFAAIAPGTTVAKAKWKPFTTLTATASEVQLSP